MYTMKKLLLTLVIFPLTLFADNWYVRPGGAGANDGTDWNNAWDSANIGWSNVSAGDTVWLAGGNYSRGLSVRASGSSGNAITINRVLSTDSVPTSAAGWSTSFDSTVQFSGSISLPSASNVTIDGRKAYTATVGSRGVANAGITVSIPLSGGDGIDGATSGSISNDTIGNVSIVGPYASTSNPSGGGGISGINVVPSNNAVTNCTFHRISIVGTGEAIRASNWNGVIIEYCYIADTANDGQQHEDIQYSYPSSNCIWRYNQINNSPNDGVFFEYGGASNFYFYGNVYYNSEGWLICTKAASGSVYGPLYIYNNTFMCSTPNPDVGGAWVSNNGADMTGSTQVYNNIFYNVTNGFNGSGVTSDYNAYNYTSLQGAGWPSKEVHSFTFSGNPFVSLPPDTQPVGTIGDFHLVPALEALFERGLSLAQNGFINKTLDGITRGSVGPWYVGAYEYGSANSTPTPTPTPTPGPSPTPTPNPSPSPTPTPGTTTTTLFSRNSTPANVNWPDPSSVTLGVKFQSSIGGTVTAIRFYKGTLDLGPHAVALWDANGTLLAKATSSSETLSGWQQVNLASPVSISPNTTYTAAFDSNGFYSVNGGYFSSSLTSGPLTAPARNNGVYAYGNSSSFPTASYNSTNYWVDVVFSD
jgi:hypothetical protein